MRREWLALLGVVALVALVFGLYSNGEGKRRPKIREASKPLEKATPDARVIENITRRPIERKNGAPARLDPIPSDVLTADISGVKAAMKAHTKDLTPCFSDRAALPESGRVQLSVTLEGGKVVEVLPAGVDAPELGSCVQRALAGEKFDTADGSVTVRYPYVFSMDAR